MNEPTIIRFPQGSPEWHAHRAQHFNASDAPAMLGISHYQSRAELLGQVRSGIPAEIDEATQILFDRGHRYEAQARPIAESLIGEELFPSVMARDVDGLKLSASLDGLNMGGDLAWEHKTLNSLIQEALAVGEIPELYRAQMEQQLIVSGASRCLFMASRGTPETAVNAWYESDPEMRSRIIAGWHQFQRDLENHVPTPAPPAPVAQPIQALPALRLDIEGRVVATNLDQFQTAAKALIGAIKIDLSTDQDFADAEATVKFCKDAEGKLEVVKSQALAQTATIDEVFRVMDGLKEELRQKRLALEKSVKVRKEEVRAELIAAAHAEIADHVTRLNALFEQGWIATPPRAWLGEAIRGKKTVATCRDALQVRVGELYAELSAQADRYTKNRENLKRETRDWISLFPDFQSVGAQATESFEALATLRINKHMEAEAERARLERERIERETEARVRAEEAAKAKAEADRIAERARAEAYAKAKAAAQSAQFAESAPTQPTQVAGHPSVEEFLKTRDYGKNQERIRQILNEFVEFYSHTF